MGRLSPRRLAGASPDLLGSGVLVSWTQPLPQSAGLAQRGSHRRAVTPPGLLGKLVDCCTLGSKGFHLVSCKHVCPPSLVMVPYLFVPFSLSRALSHSKGSGRKATGSRKPQGSGLGREVLGTMQSGEPRGWYGYRWGQVRRSLLAQNSNLGSGSGWSGAPRGHSQPVEGPRPHTGAPCTAIGPRGEGGTLCIPPSKDPGPGWTPLSLLCLPALRREPQTRSPCRDHQRCPIFMPEVGAGSHARSPHARL